eukprot:1022740_1
MSNFLLSFLLFISYTILSLHSQVHDICWFSPDGGNTTYDLTPLSKMGKLHATDESNSHFKYYFTICQNLTGDPCNPDLDKGTGCIQWTDNQCTHRLSAWTADPPFVDFAVNSSFPDQGVLVEFANGELCYSEAGRNHPYRTQFIFLCDKNERFKTMPVHQNEHETCLFELTMKSYYACAGYDPHAQETGTGLSMGYIVIILFFTAIALILVLYYIFRNKKQGLGYKFYASTFEIMYTILDIHVCWVQSICVMDCKQSPKKETRRNT